MDAALGEETGAMILYQGQRREELGEMVTQTTETQPSFEKPSITHMNGEENTAALNLSPNRTSEKDDIGQHIQRKASKLENLVSSFLKRAPTVTAIATAIAVTTKTSSQSSITQEAVEQDYLYISQKRKRERERPGLVIHNTLPNSNHLKSLKAKPGGRMANNVPQPGPAKLSPNADLEEWLEQAKQCKYLPEPVMKKLCERTKECLMEESNIQPVCTPVTICGDIHGQFYDLLELFRVAGGMPGETNVLPPTTKTTVISSEDIEPPTRITNPSLRSKIRNSDSGLESGSGEDDEDDEPRGRPRTAGPSSRVGSAGGDSGIGVNEVSGNGGNQSFIFLGDFVDRGYFSLETFTLLMCLKAMYPDKITLVRGNHESRQITQVYGFYEECQQKYGNASVWKSCCQVFDFLVLAAVVDGEILCVHGGLSPEIRTVDQIRVVARAQEIPHEGAFCDLVWSDPEDVDTWAVSPRGAGWLFGDKVATEFNHVNGLKLIARAHQLVNEGYKYHFSQKSVVTVWSAPNYCYRCGNVASIMNVGEDLNPKFSIFSAVPEDQRAVPAGRRGAGEYFL